MKIITRPLALAVMIAATAATLTACGGSGQPVTYAPAAYGANGQCYYVDSPAEAIALERAGLCPPSWHPAPMPVSWLEEYYPYYDSPAYYDTYVPARVRTVYVTRQRSFGASHRSAITTLTRKATYRGSNGSTVRGTKLGGKTRFGSGTSFGSTGRKYGGGSARTGTSNRTSRTGTSSGSRSSSRSGSFGGGSARSGRH
jgi:hypothetical protein